MLTDLWPTTGVQFTSDEHAAILAGLVVKNSSGVPRAGVLPRHTNALVTARPDMRVNVLPMELVHAKEGARFAALTETIDVAIPNPPSANTQYNIVAYVGTDQKLTGTVSTSDFVVVPGTPSATPSDPALPDAAIPIARVAVPSTATATNSAGVVITPLHPFTAAAGSTVLFRTKADLDAWTGAAQAQKAYVTATNLDYVRVGGSWEVAYGPSGVDAAGWTWITMANGKRRWYRYFVEWSAPQSFGPAGGSFWTQNRQSGINPPTGVAWDAVIVRASCWGKNTAFNGLQQVLLCNLSIATGSTSASLSIFNPTAITVANTSMELRAAIELIEI